MDSTDFEVLRAAVAWTDAGHRCWLTTVIETYGSAPRPIGSMAVLRDDGHVVGSVSGGCDEDDIVDLLKRDAAGLSAACELVYGQSAEERARLKLPCGGHLRLWIEPVLTDLAQDALERIDAGELCRRTIDLASGRSLLERADVTDASGLAGRRFVQLFGPRSRLILIGAAEVSRYLGADRANARRPGGRHRPAQRIPRGLAGRCAGNVER